MYRLVGGARVSVQRALAATLRAGAGAVLTGPAALALLDLDGFGAFNEEQPFEVLLPSGRRLSNPPFPHRRDPDPQRAVTRRGEIRIVGPMDALIDSARFAEEIGARRIPLAHDVLRWRGLSTPGRLGRRIAELGSAAPGGAMLADLLELDGQAATGDGERRLGVLLSRFDPRPAPQVWVTPHRRVDWWFRALRFGWEYQGTVDHLTRDGRLRDARRDEELRRAGARLAHVTARDLDDEAAFLATAAASMTVRASELGLEAPRLRGA